MNSNEENDFEQVDINNENRMFQNSNQPVQFKITRLNENFLVDLKRKRKESTDSLDSLELDREKPKKTINVQLIDKNDKKLVKLNLNSTPSSASNNSFLPTTIGSLRSQITRMINEDGNKPSNLSTSVLENDDDLPSESDVSAGMTVAMSSLLSNDRFVSLTKLECIKCDRIFTTESLYKHHLENDDCGDENCLDENELQRFLAVEKNRRAPEQKSGKKRLQLICSECGYEFHLQSELNKHMSQVHEKSEHQKTYRCSQCGMEFFELSSKSRHEKEHAGIKPFRCYICSFEFTRASNLRTHLLKMHQHESGTLFTITKSADNKLKFEFNIDAINSKKEQNRLSRLTQSTTSSSSSLPSSPENANNSLQQQPPTNNTIIYIKDPKNKNADIQHMVVYVDGKPIFVQNPNIDQNKTINVTKSEPKSYRKTIEPITMMPYLLATAAAAAQNHRRKLNNSIQSQLANAPLKSSSPSSYHHHHNYNNINSDDSSSECVRTMGVVGGVSNSGNGNGNKSQELKHDQEYMQLVSMFKRKNEKLHNPLLNKSF